MKGKTLFVLECLLLVSGRIFAQPTLTITTPNAYYCGIGDTATYAIEFVNYTFDKIDVQILMPNDSDFNIAAQPYTVYVPGVDSFYRPGHAYAYIYFHPVQDTSTAYLSCKYLSQTDTLILRGYRTHPWPNVDCKPFPYTAIPIITSDSALICDSLILQNLTRDTTDVRFSFLPNDFSFQVSGIRDYLLLGSGESHTVKICHYPKKPGWNYDTLKVELSNSRGDTTMSFSFKIGYGHIGPRMEITDSTGFLPGGDILSPCLKLRDSCIYRWLIGFFGLYREGYYWINYHNVNVTGDSQYVTPWKFTPFIVEEGLRGGNYVSFNLLVHPDIRKIIVDPTTSLKFTLHFDEVTSDLLPLLYGDSEVVHANFKLITPPKDTLDLYAPTYLANTDIGYRTIAYQMSLPTNSVVLIIRSLKDYDTRVISASIDDTVDFSIGNNFPFNQTLDGRTPLEIKFIGRDTGLFQSTFRLHVQSGFDNKDTVFTIPIIAYVTSNLSKISDGHEPPHVSVFPNPTIGRLGIELSNAMSAEILGLDVLGNEILYGKLNPGLNYFDISNSPGIVFLRFFVTETDGKRTVITRKIIND